MNPNHTCTAASPYNPAKHARADHPDAEVMSAEIEVNSLIETIEWCCPWCGITWTEKEETLR